METVVLLHGLAARPWVMWPIGRMLRKSGFRTVSLGYQSRNHTLDGIIAGLRDQIAVEAETATKLHFVTHSMGGLIARALLCENPPEKLDRVVMLGPPNQGSEWISLLARMGIDRLALRHATDLLTPEREAHIAAKLGTVSYPVGIIAGNRPIDPIFPRLFLPQPSDGKVSVASTHIASESDHIVLAVPHTAMLWHGEVHRQIVAFLKDGRFARDSLAADIAGS